MRTTQEVFENHILLTLDWDQDLDITQNYSPDCDLLTSFGAFKGHDGVKSFLEIINQKLPDADYLYINRLWKGEIAFLEWQAESPVAFVDDGAESFLIRNGLIVSQTVHCTIRVRSS
jgi:hypothetical protein